MAQTPEMRRAAPCPPRLGRPLCPQIGRSNNIVTPPPRERGGFSLGSLEPHDGQALTAARGQGSRVMHARPFASLPIPIPPTAKAAGLGRF